MTLIDKRNTYRPFEYEKAYQYFENACLTHWLWTKVGMSGDILDWQTMTETEKNIVAGVLNGFTQCYDKETEVLTDSGWKLFSNLTKDDKVAQFENGFIEFVYPLDIYIKYYEGKMHHYKDEIGRVDLLVTPNHRLLYKTEKEVYKIKRSFEMNWGQRNYHVTSAQKKGSLDKLSPDERIWIAYQADGTSNRTSGLRNGYISNKIVVCKERKKDRLRHLLNQSSYSWEEKILEDKEGFSEFIIKTDTPIPKHFDWVDVTNISTNWSLEFIDELSNWDSHVDNWGKIIYTNCNKEDVDVVQTVATYTGKYCQRSLSKDLRKQTYNDIHCLRFQKSKEGLVNGQSMKRGKSLVDYKDNIYCVTVPSGVIVVRRNFCVSISGNTELVVGDYWSTYVTKWFPKAEIASMATTFASFEGIHARSYNNLVESLGLEDYDAFEQDTVVKARLENLIDCPKDSIEDIARSLAIFSAFCEGVCLFSSFVILKYFPTKNKLKGVGTIIDWSLSDERSHSEAGCWLFRQLLSEMPEINPNFNYAQLREHVYEGARTVIELESKFVDEIFNGNVLEDLNPYDLKQYIRYRINLKLEELGYEGNFKVDLSAANNIKSWFDVTTGSQKQQDFFASMPTDYTRNALAIDDAELDFDF